MIAHYSKYPRPTRLERRVPVYFEEWLSLTRLEEQSRAGKEPTEFKSLGGGGEEDPEAWIQWFEYIEWIAEGQPDALSGPRTGDEDEDEPEPEPEEEEQD